MATNDPSHFMGEMLGRNVPYRSIFSPSSIAVYGASRSPQKLGHRAVQVLTDHSFPGALFPINPHALEIAGIKAYPGLESVPQSVDLALIAVPAEQVLAAFSDAVTHGVSAGVIFSSGFAESGPRGRELESDIAALSAEAGVPFIGPNCEGVINNYSNLYALISGYMFAETAPTGGVSMVSQSGAYTGLLYHALAQQNVGVSKFVSIGNEAGVTVAELLSYFLEDQETEVVALHLEGLRNTDAFREHARALTEHKTLIINQVGRTRVGSQVASTHTGTLAGGGRAVEALYRDAGAIVTHNSDEFIDVVASASTSRGHVGDRIGVISFSGGIRVEAVDLLTEAAFSIPSVTAEVVRELGAIVPPHGSPKNPVDMADGLLRDPACASKCVRAISKDPSVDVIVVLLTVTSDLEIASTLVDAANAVPQPVFFCCTAPDVSEAALRLIRRHGYVVHESVLRLKNAMAAFRARPVRGEVGNTGKVASALEPPARHETASESTMGLGASFELLSRAGMRFPPYIRRPKVDNVDASELSALQAPFAVKLDLPAVAHKTQAGLVRLGCTSVAEVNTAIHEVKRAWETQFPRVRADGVVIQEMVASDGPELLIGFERDAVAGPIAVVGAGGLLAELLDDIAILVLPASHEQIAAALRTLRIAQAPALSAWFGPPFLGRLSEFIARGAAWFVEAGWVQSVDLNPVLIADGRPVSVDAVIGRAEN